jgi:hypothetical protein
VDVGTLTPVPVAKALDASARKRRVRAKVVKAGVERAIAAATN